MSANGGYLVNFDQLPELYPTHLHGAAFWEWLGRTVATYGFLENVLARAIFAFSGTRQYSEDEVQAALEKWIPKLEQSLADTLYPLIQAYEKEVLSHQSSPPEGLGDLIESLKEAAQLRNVLCHGFWNPPNEEGAAIPFFMRSKDKKLFDTPVDVMFLQRTQRATMELSAAVINTVTVLGYRFPGTSGPGRPVG